MNWQSYPLIRLVIPMIIGMAGADLLYDYVSTRMAWLVALMFLNMLVVVFLQIKSDKETLTRYFTIATITFFTLFGLTITVNSISKAEQEHGKNWKYSLYRNNGGCIDSVSNKIQKDLHEVYESHGISGQDGSVTEAMTIGRKDDISKSTRQDFSKAGLSHLLAISGFHISIIFVILQCIFLGRIVTYKWKIVSDLVIVFCLWAYTFVTGMQPSIIRAVVMCTILVLAHCAKREAISINTCALAAFIMLCFDPLLIFHIGFQLSFLAVTGILTIGIPLCKTLRIHSNTKSGNYIYIKKITVKLYNGTMSIIVISLVCNIITMPLVSYYFHQIPLLSVFSNLTTTILVTILIPTTCIWWLFLWNKTICGTLTAIILHCSSHIRRIAHFFAEQPSSTYQCQPSILDVVMAYLFITTIAIWLKNNNSKNTISMLTASILWMATVIAERLIK